MEINIRNCIFGFKCEREWTYLEETEDPAIRFCYSCKKNVFYVHKKSELLEAIKLNRCVALICPADRKPEHLPLLGKVADYDEIYDADSNDFIDS